MAKMMDWHAKDFNRNVSETLFLYLSCDGYVVVQKSCSVRLMHLLVSFIVTS
jgi:hypothetical protein